MKLKFLLLVTFFSITQLQSQEVLSIEKISTQVQFILEIAVGVPLESSVDVYKVNYTTEDLDGNETEASGTLYIPFNMDEPLGTIVYGHGTVNSRLAVPSYGSQEQFIPAAMAAKGYVAVCADYLGLGDSEGLHPYVHAASAAWTNRDLLIAARTYLEEEGSIIDMEMPNELFITGYSQGGHTAMALHQYLETVDAHGFEVELAVPMSGPYSIEYIYNDILDVEKAYDYPAYIAWVILSYQRVYGNIYESVADFFKPEVASTIMSYASSEIELDELNGTLISYLVNNYGDTYAARILKEDVLQGLLDDPDNNLAIASRANNVYDWAPEAMTRLLYCEADDQVQFENSILADQTMNANGANDVSSVNINADFNHAECIIPAVRYFVELLEGPPTSTTEVEVVQEIYPNPAYNVVYLKGYNLEKVEVYNAMGLLIDEVSDFNGQIDVSNYSTGMYVLRIFNDENQHEVAKLIVR